jgi:hypothetical protein
VNPLLLADPSPSLRFRALTELGDVATDDPEAAALPAAISASAEVKRALAVRPSDSAGLGYLLCRLAYLRYDGPEVSEIAEQVFDRMQPDGSWPLWLDERPAAGQDRGRGPRRPRSETYTAVPIQTALPLRGLAAVGHATDPRAERAYECLLRQRLDDGAWPGDRKADLPPSEVPGYRRLPGSSGCRASTTAVVACLALHPVCRTSAITQMALGHLLAAATHEEWSLGWEVARLLGLEAPRGRFTFYARVDLAFLLDLATRCQTPASDARLSGLIDVLEARRGPFGLWEHAGHPQLSRWLTLDIDTSLQRLSGPATRASSPS